jgi:hypothetical protein
MFILTSISSLGQIVSKPLSVAGLAHGLDGGTRSGHFGDNDKLCELHHFLFFSLVLLLFFLIHSFEIQHHAGRLFSSSKRNRLSSYGVVIDAGAMRFPLRQWSRESESAAEERATSWLYVFTFLTFYPG